MATDNRMLIRLFQAAAVQPVRRGAPAIGREHPFEHDAMVEGEGRLRSGEWISFRIDSVWVLNDAPGQPTGDVMGDIGSVSG